MKIFPSSPSYWENERPKMLATIRQLGMPTLFITLSAAETQWAELLVSLTKILDEKDITEEDALKLSFAEKARLISTDPVTCARYFDHRFRALFKLF